MTVGKFSSVHSSMHLRRIYRPLLAFLMFLGLLCGVIFAVDLEPVFLSLMRTAVFSRVSIVRLMSVLLVPFIFSALAVFTSSLYFLYPVCFIKAFSFGICAGMVLIAYGNAGWLVRWLLLFSSGMTLPLLIWFCLRHLDGNRRQDLFKDFSVCAAMVFLVGSLDLRVISPFLVKLIK